MKIACRLYFLLYFFCIAFSLNAQYGTHPQIINFSKSEYGASSQNWAIDQDDAGHLFVANNRGLLVFNGSWQLYELPGQQITRSVACDTKGRVYTGAFGEFGFWQKQPLGNYVYHSLTKLIHFPRFAKEEIWKILIEGEEIYFQSFSTLYHYNGHTIEAIDCPGNIMYAFFVKKHLYVQVLQKGLFELRESTLVSISNDIVFKKNEVISIVPYSNDALLIGTVHDGFYLFDKGHISPFVSEISTITKQVQLNVTIAFSDEKYAVGTIQDGLYIVNQAGKIIEHFNQENGLQNNTVLAIKKDRVGNIWSCLDHGLDEIVVQSPFRYFIDNKGIIGTLYASALYKGKLYVGSNHGLFVYNNLLNKYQQIPHIKGQVWSLSQLGGQLFCAHNSGTSVVNNDDIESAAFSGGGWAIKRLGADSNYAIQGTYIGLALYKKSEDGHYKYLNIIKGSENISISDWVEDDKGHLWLTHAYKGINVISLNQDKDSIIASYSVGEKDGLSAKYHYALAFYKGDILAVSVGGTFKWNTLNRRFIVANIWSNWNNSAFSRKIVINQDGSIWFIKDDDQCIYQTIEGKASLYNLKDFSLVGGYETILPFDTSKYFLCGENGFALFDSKFISSPINYKPEINQVLVSKKGKYFYINEVGKLEHGIWKIKYSERNIKVVAGITVYDRKILYRFRLLNGKNAAEWSEWQKAPARLYNNLQPGKYSIQIQTNVTPQIAELSMEVFPPWFNSWFADIIYLIVIGFFLWCLFKWIETRHENTVKQKNKEMEEKLLLQKIQHEKELLLLRQEKLENEVQIKSEDLANSASELIKRKKLLNKLFVELEKQKEDKENAPISLNMRRLSKELERQLALEKEETRLFEEGFNTVHDTFFNKLLEIYPKLTPPDLKLAAYLRMNLGSKEIAPLLSITVRGVELKRYRLRRKIGLSEEANLNEFMIKF